LVSQNLANAFIAARMPKGARDSPELRNEVREGPIRHELLARQAKMRQARRSASGDRWARAAGEMRRHSVMKYSG
jgi:hypothetical protein